MHRYITAIGFNNIHTRIAEKGLLREVERFFSYNQIVSLENDDYAEFKKNVGDRVGVSSCGVVNDCDEFEREYYFPYFESNTVSSYADIVVDKRKDRESFMGICEDVRMGVSLIFHLQNGVEYMKASREGTLSKKGTSVALSGLALKGTVLLPIMKTPKMIQSSQEEMRNRMMLVSAAKKGDSEAMESLTMDDMDTYTTISRRILVEDVFSIVDTYFMPYGIECDEYSVMGEIKELKETYNEYTNVLLYQMVLEVNEMHMEICVPAKELLGEPAVGRRFKGVIWLQGKINFPK